MATEDYLKQEILEQSVLVKKLQGESAETSIVDGARQKLGEMKKNLALVRGASGGRDAGQKKERLLLKTAKGTRDYGPNEMFLREHVERIVKECFTSYGGGQLDTPVFERKDILTDKYGEDTKLIFDLMDQGGEQLALRYDHTVPLSRYLASTLSNNSQSKIWQVGKVYRRDNPVMSKGRMREFSQADFDITGAWDPMIPEGELISLLCTVLTRLEVGDFTVKLNHRKILDGIFEVCGVPSSKIRTISSAVDKLDKLPWAEVKKEMTEEKGLDPVVADKIGEYVKHKGGPALLESLQGDATLTSNANAKEGLAEMAVLFTLLKAYGVSHKILFDLSLARGLDYYTGLIYEAIVAASAPPGLTSDGSVASTEPSSSRSAAEPPVSSKKLPKNSPVAEDEQEIDENSVGIGSIAAGGRYDNLVGQLISAASGDKKKPIVLPCIGVSIGLDRIFAILWPRFIEQGRSKETLAYVMAAGDGLLEARIQLATELREAGVKSDFLAKTKPKLTAQFTAGERDNVPFAIILGADELKEGFVTVKEQRWENSPEGLIKVKSDDRGTRVKRSELISWIKSTETWKELKTKEWIL